MKNLLFIIISVHLHVHNYGQYNYRSDRYCVESAICKLIRGDVYREVGKPHMEHYNNANIQLKKHYQIRACDQSGGSFTLFERITEKCKKNGLECEIQLKNDLVSELKISLELLDEEYHACPVTTYPYLIFLCKWVHEWPANITVYNGSNLMKAVCNDACYRMIDFQNFNINRGKTKADFPSNWDEKLKGYSKIYPFKK